jgi:hypothetical protein
MGAGKDWDVHWRHRRGPGWTNDAVAQSGTHLNNFGQPGQKALLPGRPCADELELVYCSYGGPSVSLPCFIVKLRETFGKVMNSAESAV